MSQIPTSTSMSVPSLQGIALQTELSKKEQHYKGIITNLVMERILVDAIQDMSSCRQCSSSELVNMVTDQVSMAAARRK